MIRILIDIKNASPFLHTVSGIFRVEHTDYRKTYNKITPLVNGSFSRRIGDRISYHVEGEYKHIFKKIRPQIEIMITSYGRGLIVAPHDYSFIEGSNEKTLEEWIEEERK